jgi:2-polyprenyl-3-methyl-5-hydroxy-6-metoxy-1,4-benzoquinol methylase
MRQDSPRHKDVLSIQPWPNDGLEAVPACPVCARTERQLVHESLTDRVFECAPGKWTLYQCNHCATGWLDPRPNRATIGQAYTKYFTHDSAVSVIQPPRTAWRRYRVAQRNAYLNAQYGYRLTPAARTAPARLSIERRQRFDKLVDYLPYPGPGARLLDVGCGNGRFIMYMRSAGWDVAGVEPDPQGAAAAVAAGLKVRTGLLEPGSEPDAYYDAITLNHVIEHLHQPLEILRLCRQALKPGGAVFIATPNFSANGHRHFGRDWFPLDPPRHLMLFTFSSLRQLLRAAELEPDPAVRTRAIAQETYLQSLRLRLGHNPLKQRPRLGLLDRWRIARLAKQADRATLAQPELTEELVLLGHRPT